MLTRRHPSRILVVALLTVALAVGMVGPAAARTLEPGLETQLVNLTNQARAAHGLRGLPVELQLTRVARDWSNTMASRQELSHRPRLSSVIDGNWQRIGENVGVGPSVERIQQAFMDSPGHRANVLGDYDRIGVGIYEQDGRLWITVNFLKGSGDFPVFQDVRTNTHRTNVEGLFARGTTLGCSFDRYCPSAGVTRGQMATFLARELGLSPKNGGFRDVPSSHPHAGAIGALAAAGITTGCGSNKFCPEDRVNRAQMATFLRRAKGLPETAPSGLSDVPSSHTHAGSIGALQKAGITQGCTSTRYCPTDGVTRAQMATFLQRSFA
ncbi:S-layer homology domain-containing protein [Nitriliruptor alkaliphilus]|uniref:CAP and S-layer homology domain-containing protein n=1 Tax=Nitriliruptor alkaliphilus TaxID=427918 RepID=UPI0006968E30|nr:S-layer homology domain-containing protein [Nitriliruptor alkaliphilus]